MALFVKLSSPHYSGAQITAIRSGFSLLIIGGLFWSGLLRLSFSNLKLLWLRGLLGGSAALCYFTALEHTTVGKASLLNNTSPLFVAMFSSLFLKESLTWDLWLSLGIAFGGIALVIHPTAANVNLGDLLGLLSGALAAWAYISIRTLRKTDSTWAIFLFFSLGGLLCALPFSVGPWHTPTLLEAGYLGGMWVTAWVAQMVMTYSLKYVKAAEGGILGLSTGVFATLWGVAVLGEPVTWNFLAGGALVCGGCGWTLYRRAETASEPPQPLTPISP